MPTRATTRRSGTKKNSSEENDSKGKFGKRKDWGNQKAEHENDDARCCSPELAWQEEVVCRGGHGVDLSAGRIVQEGCRDDCAEPGFEEGIAEGAVVGHADADLLCEPRGQEPAAEPAAGAGACQGASARAGGEGSRFGAESQLRFDVMVSSVIASHPSCGKDGACDPARSRHPTVSLTRSGHSTLQKRSCCKSCKTVCSGSISRTKPPLSPPFASELCMAWFGR